MIFFLLLLIFIAAVAVFSYATGYESGYLEGYKEGLDYGMRGLEDYHQHTMAGLRSLEPK